LTLAPRAPKQKPKVFSTYDLEWYPKTYKLRMCGVYDPEKGYRSYATMADFLCNELTTENYGRTFFAHNSGKSDMHFVLDELLKSGLAMETFEIDATFNGSSAFLVYIRKRDNPKQSFVFADTLFLLKASLRKIGEWLGYSKFQLKDGFDTENYHELRAYNERDCDLLYKAVKQLEDELWDMGGEFKVTLASSAMALFQTRYLSEILPTDKGNNDYARRGYYASRVEVFTRKCEQGIYYDVNSSFPWSMKQSLPGAFRGTRPSLSMKPKGAKHAIAEATVHIKDCYLPPAPFRDADNRIIFPTGQWRGVFTDVDLKLLESAGHEIVKVHSVDWYDGFTALGDYVDDLYEKKAKAKGFKREVYKLLLNSLYGKFAEKETKYKLLLHPSSLACTHKPIHPGAVPSCMTMIRPNVFMREDQQALRHVHVPISAYVTAFSRKLLYDYLSQCSKIYYCDTDSVVCSASDKLPTGDEVGQLKMEYLIRSGTFSAPKLYMMQAIEPSKDGPMVLSLDNTDPMDDKTVVRSKGFSALDGSSYLQLCQGEAITLSRMSGIRENLRKGDTTPREIRIAKMARFKRTKRADLANGETRPWTISELESETT